LQLGRLVAVELGDVLVTVNAALGPDCATGGPPRPLPPPDGTPGADASAGAG
jgi:hypothetical protein